MSSQKPNQPLQLKIRDIEIPNDNEWPCSEDCLDRYKEIENLTPVLLNAEAPLVLAVDSPWGGGKTTFIRIWQHYLSKRKNCASVYLNAWENDFTGDPLLSLVAQLDKELFSQGNDSEDRSYWEEAKEAIPSLLKGASASIGKQLTIGGVNVGQVAIDVTKTFEKHSGQNLVKDYLITQESMNRFRQLLEESLSCLSVNQQNLIIFVDELDRCNPVYAVMMLERIKHLFDVKNIVFVLSINSEQLVKSFGGIYGSDFDGKNYLKRFIDLDYKLKASDIDTYIDLSFNQPDIQAYMDKIQEGRYDLEWLTFIVKLAVSYFNYQLRDIDQLVMRIRLILLSVPQDRYLDPVILACMLILRENNHALYLNYINDPLQANKVVEFLTRITPASEKIPDKYSTVAGLIINVAYSPYSNQGILDAILKPWVDALETTEENSDRAYEIGHLIELSKDRKGLRHGNLRKLAFERIELMHQINIQG